MASGDAWVRKVMTDPFALGGAVENGEREEDQDRVLTKVFRDGAIKSWVAPHVYAFFETRVVRRSNELHRTLVGGPDKGPYYGSKLNVTVYTLMPSEVSDSAWFPSISQLEVASTASSRCYTTVAPSS